MASTSATTRERELLDAARGGDQEAYGRLVEPYRGELHAHCYRMLGSVHDAEDALQDALLRAWRGLSRFEGRSAFRSWLYTIATNACLTAIERRPKRVLPIDYGPSADPHSEGIGVPPAESAWVEPYPDEAVGLGDGFAAPEARYELRESVELAFVAAIQHLPVDERLPEQSQQATLRQLGDEHLRRVVEGYMDAMHRGDVDAVVGLLAEDATWSMPPLPGWFRGEDALRGFMLRGPLSGDWRWRHLPARASGQAAVGSYSWYEEDGSYRPFALDVLTLEGERIKAITSFITRSTLSRDRHFYERWPEQPFDAEQVVGAFERFGLPGRIDESGDFRGS